MRGFRQTDFDDRIIRHITGAGWREGRKLPQLLRCEGDDLHVLTKEHHGVQGNGDRPAAQAENPAEIDHDHNLTICITNDAMNPAQNILALDWAKDVSTDKIADANWLRKARAGRFGEAHASRGWHPPRCLALRVRCAGHCEQAADDRQDERQAGARRGAQIPANHGKPRDSQYPPEYVLVTSMAVTHFGFL